MSPYKSVRQLSQFATQESCGKSGKFVCGGRRTLHVKHQNLQGHVDHVILHTFFLGQDLGTILNYCSLDSLLKILSCGFFLMRFKCIF